MPTDHVLTLLQGKDREDLGVVVDIRRLPEMDLRAFRATAAKSFVRSPAPEPGLRGRRPPRCAAP